MKRKIALLLLLVTVCTLFTGCAVIAAGDTCVKLSEDALTEEAIAAFSSLEGERGVMLYSDPRQMSSRKIRMYVVLYDPLGRELSLQRSFTTLKMKVEGEPVDGYAVWKIEYNPFYVRRAEFMNANGENIIMDGYSELTFVVETALKKEK